MNEFIIESHYPVLYNVDRQKHLAVISPLCCAVISDRGFMF